MRILQSKNVVSKIAIPKTDSITVKFTCLANHFGIKKTVKK